MARDRRVEALRWPGKLKKYGTERTRRTGRVKREGRLRRLIYLEEAGLLEGAEVMETVGSVYVSRESPGSSEQAVCLLGENKRATRRGKYGGRIDSFIAEAALPRGTAVTLLPDTVAGRSSEGEISRDRAGAVGDGAGLAAGAGTRSGKMAAAQETDGAGSAVVAAGGGGSGQVRRPRGDRGFFSPTWGASHGACPAP